MVSLPFIGDRKGLSDMTPGARIYYMKFILHD